MMTSCNRKADERSHVVNWYHLLCWWHIRVSANASRCFLGLSRNVSVWKCFVFTLYNPYIYLWNQNIIYPILVESTSNKAIGRGNAPVTYTQSKYLKHAKVYSPYENPKACLNQVTLGSDVCPMKGPADTDVCLMKGPCNSSLPNFLVSS